MRLSNAWEKAKVAVGIAFGAVMLLYCGKELYSAWADGTVQPVTRYLDRVTFQSNPVWFVSSIVAHTLFLAAAAALCALALCGFGKVGRWRTRPDIDSAVRQGPEER